MMDGDALVALTATETGSPEAMRSIDRQVVIANGERLPSPDVDIPRSITGDGRSQGGGGSGTVGDETGIVARAG